MKLGLTKNCVVCQSEKIKKIFVSQNKHGRYLLDAENKFDVFSCLECGCIFLREFDINSDYYKKYYGPDYYKNAGDSILSRLAGLLSKFSIYRKQKLILSNVTSGRDKVKILDVGCATGGFLLGLSSQKFLKSGIEINPDGFDLCKRRGLMVYNQDLVDIDFVDKKFDVVTMWHVLEHLRNPVDILNKINTILFDDGIFVFQTPNTEGLGLRYGRENWFHLDSPRHLILYSEESIRRLCELTGFRIVSVRNETYDYPLDLFWSVRKSTIRYLFYPLYPIMKLFSRETLTFVCKKI